MKKLLIATSVALLALSFQASAAPKRTLELSIEENQRNASEINLMSIVGSSIVDAEKDFVVGAAKTRGGWNGLFEHDWGLTVESSYSQTEIGGFTPIKCNGCTILAVNLYTDTFFSKILDDSYQKYFDSEIYFGGNLTRAHTYGLRILGYNNNSMGSYSFSVGSPMPIPGAVWLFGSGMAGLLGLSRRKAKTGTLSV